MKLRPPEPEPEPIAGPDVQPGMQPAIQPSNQPSIQPHISSAEDTDGHSGVDFSSMALDFAGLESDGLMASDTMLGSDPRKVDSPISFRAVQGLMSGGHALQSSGGMGRLVSPAMDAASAEAASRVQKEAADNHARTMQFIQDKGLTVPKPKAASVPRTSVYAAIALARNSGTATTSGSSALRPPSRTDSSGGLTEAHKQYIDGVLHDSSRTAAPPHRAGVPAPVASVQQPAAGAATTATLANVGLTNGAVQTDTQLRAQQQPGNNILQDLQALTGGAEAQRDVAVPAVRPAVVLQKPAPQPTVRTGQRYLQFVDSAAAAEGFKSVSSLTESQLQKLRYA